MIKTISVKLNALYTTKTLPLFKYSQLEVDSDLNFI